MGLTRVRAEQILDIDYKQAVRVIATSNVSNLATSAPSVVDGVAVSLNDRVLVNGQTTSSQNGIYYVAVVGTGSNGTWVRSNDANATGEINAGMIVMVTEGALYADTLWKLITNNPIIIDVTGLEFVLNSQASFDVINANGTPVSANTVSSTINYTSGNNLVITGSDMTDTVLFAVADAPDFSGNVTTQGNLFVARDISVTGNLTIGANLNVVNVNEYVGATGNISFLGNLLPGSSNVINYSLGLPGQPWSNIFVANLNVALFTGTDLSITGTQTSNILIVNNDATVNGNLTVLGTTTTINSNIIVTNDKNIELANNISALINLDGAGLLAGNAANTHVTNWTYNYAANAWSTNVGVSAVGNVQGSYILGNGSQLTGLPEQYSNANVVTLLSAFGNNTISTTGNITANVISNVITFNTTASAQVGPGQMAWDTADGTANIGLTYGNVVLQVGQETHYVVRNETGITIPDGTAVYCSGVTPSGRIAVSPMIGNGSVSAVQFLGLATMDLTSGVNGVVTWFGYVRDLDTRGTANTAISVGNETWAVGDKLYVHPTAAGKLTNVEPEAPNVKICVASIIIRNQTAGVLFVRPTTNLKASDLSDVQISTPVTNQFLVWAGNRWQNANLDISVDTTPSLGGNLDGGVYNISTTGNITAANIRVNAGGAIGVAPQQEFHVARNGSDADGNGSITNPYRTITYALTQVGSGGTIVVHPGGYTEDVAINNLNNIAITAAQPGAASPQTYVINGNVTVSGTSSSILLHSIGVVGSVTHSSSGSFFVTAIQLGTGASSTTFAKTGTGYLEVTNGNWQGGTPAVSVTGAGPVTFNGVQLTNLTVNNANASVLLRSIPTAINTTLTSGTLTVVTSTMYGNSNTAPAITTVAGTLNIQNSLLLRANNTAGIMSVGAATAYLYDDIFFDRTNSTLAGIPISGTAFAPPAEFQAIRADSMSVSGNNIATGNVTGGNIRTVGQITATGNITGGNIATTGNLNVTGFTKTQPTTYGSLISATTAGAGARAFVTDANTVTFNSLITGGASNNIPVFSDGTDWRVG